VLKGLNIGGPILLPPVEDLPLLACSLMAAEKAAAKKLAEKYSQTALEDAAPIQMIGSGQT
jgi:formamidase